MSEAKAVSLGLTHSVYLVMQRGPAVTQAKRRAEEAIAVCREASRINPSDYESLENLGRGLLSQRRSREAIEALAASCCIKESAPVRA